MSNAYTRVLVCVGALTLGLTQTSRAQAQQPAPSNQETTQQQQSAQQQASPGAATETLKSADVTDQEVEQFAKSYQDVVQIQKETEKQLASVQDTAAVAQVKQEANKKMAEAVTVHGLKVERFNLIARSLNEDATLKQRIQQKIQEIQKPA
jgi:hypothetical protein